MSLLARILPSRAERDGRAALDDCDRRRVDAEARLARLDREAEAIAEEEDALAHVAADEHFGTIEPGEYDRRRADLERRKVENERERTRWRAVADEGMDRCAAALAELYEERRRPDQEAIVEASAEIKRHEAAIAMLNIGVAEREARLGTIDQEHRTEADRYTSGWVKNQRRERERAVREKAAWYATRVSDDLVMVALQREPKAVRDLVEPERRRLRESALAQREADHAAALEATEAGGLHAYNPAGIAP